MIRICEISLPPEHTPEQLCSEAARLLRLSPGRIQRLRIIRRSVDARKKPNVRIVYTVDVQVQGSEDKILKNARCSRAAIAPVKSYHPPKARPAAALPPVIVGFGPAGMFAGLILALAGQKPIILERGEDAQTRHEKVERFFAAGELDESSNVQFGEGGAGTFSDGKLNTGVNNPRIQWILEQLAAAGAGEDILFDAKPHVGTDVLLTVVQNIRRRILALGGQVRFSTQVVDFTQEDGRLTGVVTQTGEHIPCHQAILAIGHSARDTFAMLLERGIPMEAKPFAMGVRIEQRQSAINAAQYGGENPVLPPADYKLAEHLEERTVYTFCMCPGGYVVAAASEQGGVVTNGMSNSRRDGENANAALLVSLNPSDFPGNDPLAGMRWQREIEQTAYRVGGGYCAPAQRVGDFLAKRASMSAGMVQPTYRPGVVWTELHQVLPEVITSALERAIPLLGRKLTGFSDPDGVLTAPETRSSSPVRILRDDTRQSALMGLYPTGEGAGYAGGIMSAAVDGILSAEALLEALESG
ncbi:MAG TPA: hypothetical protein IAC31_09270 [Candidatus Faecousia intestinigallinarum]|nr:hypothetical protein [Candidatus Faecousia intestinigallinarum]